MNYRVPTPNPKVVVVLIAPTIWTLFAWFNHSADLMDGSSALRWGAISQGLAMEEPWRIVTASLLNLNGAHLALNLAGLAVMSILAARLFGVAQLFVITWVSAWLGTLVALMEPGIILGSSGGIAGLLGAVISFMAGRLPRERRLHFGFASVIALVLIAILPGDAWAHGSGFIAGLIMGRMVKDPSILTVDEHRIRGRMAWMVGLIQLFGCAVVMVNTG